MSGFVYIWRDRKHNRYYIGSHWGDENDGYICSSSWMKQAYEKRPGDFKRRVLTRVSESRKLLIEKEEQWLRLAEPKKSKNKFRYYNMMFHAAHWASSPEDAKSIKQKIKERTAEAMKDPEVRRRYEEGLKKRPPASEENRRKRSETMKATMAKKFPVETRLTYETRKGSEGHRAKLSQSSKTRWLDPEYRQKVISRTSEGLRNSEKNKLARQGMLWWNNGTRNTRAKSCPGGEWKAGRL